MKLDEIAKRIAAHLRRFERDPEINRKRKYDEAAKRWVDHQGGLGSYWHASAQRAGSRVAVVYVSYQGATNLTRGEALAYLAWLDAGNVGTHWSALRLARATR